MNTKKSLENIKKEFESEHLIFSKKLQSFIPNIIEMYNDKRMGELLKKGGMHVTTESCIKWIEELRKNDSPSFVMVEKESNDFVGIIEITNIDENNTGYLRICIDFDKQNKHYGTESIETILNYSNDNLNLNGMRLDVFDYNGRAIRCYENVGFEIKKYNNENHSVFMSTK